MPDKPKCINCGAPAVCFWPTISETEYIKIACGQIWELTDAGRIYNVGSKGDLFIILSMDCGVWKIGCFWFFDGNEPGGARQRELEDAEIRAIGRYVGTITDYKK